MPGATPPLGSRRAGAQDLAPPTAMGKTETWRGLTQTEATARLQRDDPVAGRVELGGAENALCAIRGVWRGLTAARRLRTGPSSAPGPPAPPSRAGGAPPAPRVRASQARRRPAGGAPRLSPA